MVLNCKVTQIGHFEPSSLNCHQPEMNEILQTDGPVAHLPPCELDCLCDVSFCSYVAVKLDFHLVTV